MLEGQNQKQKKNTVLTHIKQTYKTNFLLPFLHHQAYKYTVCPCQQKSVCQLIDACSTAADMTEPLAGVKN